MVFKCCSSLVGRFYICKEFDLLGRRNQKALGLTTQFNGGSFKLLRKILPSFQNFKLWSRNDMCFGLVRVLIHLVSLPVRRCQEVFGFSSPFPGYLREALAISRTPLLFVSEVWSRQGEKVTVPWCIYVCPHLTLRISSPIREKFEFATRLSIY